MLHRTREPLANARLRATLHQDQARRPIRAPVRSRRVFHPRQPGVGCRARRSRRFVSWQSACASALACCLVVVAVPGSASDRARFRRRARPCLSDATAFSVSVDPAAGRVYAVDAANHLVRVYDTALSPAVGSFGVGPVAWIAAIDPRPASKHRLRRELQPRLGERTIAPSPVRRSATSRSARAVAARRSMPLTGDFSAGAEASQAVFSLHGPSNCAPRAVTFTGDKPIERAISIDQMTDTVFSSVHHAQQTAVIDERDGHARRARADRPRRPDRHGHRRDRPAGVRRLQPGRAHHGDRHRAQQRSRRSPRTTSP